MAVFLAVPAPASAQTADEVALVRALVAGESAASERTAAAQATDAAATAPALVANPRLGARHEQANGPAGAATDVVSAEVSLQAGGALARRAAGHAAAAAPEHRRAVALDQICAARRTTLALWQHSETLAASDAAHARLASVASTLVRLVEAGERAGHERDRLALGVLAHAQDRDTRAAAVIEAQARVEARTGQSVARVDLGALPAPPDAATAVDAALAADPTLRALQASREAAILRERAARRGALPDLTLAAGRRWDAMPDGSARAPGYEVGASLDVPLFDRNRPARATAAAETASLEARIAAQREAVRAATLAALHRVQALGPTPAPPPTDPIWQGARDRYARGEADLDELLAVAREVEAAELAAVGAAALRRAAHIDLACASGAFPEPAFQDLLEELSR